MEAADGICLRVLVTQANRFVEDREPRIRTVVEGSCGSFVKSSGLYERGRMLALFSCGAFRGADYIFKICRKPILTIGV